MKLLHTLLLFLAAPYAHALEATFTPNQADSPENGGSGGPLPQSLEQRKQLLELSVAIAQTPDPTSTLDHVAQQNGITANELGAMLERNVKDLQDSGQLEEMLQGVQANLAAQGGGGGRGASGTLPRRIVSLFASIIVGIAKAAAGQVTSHPRQSSLFAMVVIISLVTMHNIPKNGLIMSTGSSSFSRGHTTFFEPPVEYMQQHYADAWARGDWESSLTETIQTTSKKSKAKKESFGGVGMTRSFQKNLSGVKADEVNVESHRDREGFSLISTASQMILMDDVIDVEQNSDEDDSLIEEAMEVMLESISSLFGDRKFTEYTLGKTALAWRSFIVDDEEDDALEGAVMSMRLLGNFGRFGIQPFCFSYELDGDNMEDTNDSSMIRCVAFHTLKGGHFDGEIRFAIDTNNDKTGAIISVTLAIQKGGRLLPIRLAESMVESFTESIVRSSQLRIKQAASRRSQSKHYRARSAARAKEKRHLRYEQERLQEEMAAERKRKWKRNNPDAGHYRPSGHRLRGPGGSPNFAC